MTTTGPAEETAPAPRPARVVRFARRHKLTTAVAVLAAVALAVRLGVGWHLGRQWAAAQDDLRRRGEPATAAELRPPAPLGDDENAWTLLGQAAALAAAGPSSPSSSNFSYPDYPPFGPLWDQAAAASEQANQATFKLARQARQRPRAQFPRPPGVPLYTVLLPHLSPARHLANTVGDGATLSHLNGDDVEAVERVLDVLHLARTIRDDDFVVSQLVGTGIDALAVVRAQVIATGLRVEQPAVRTRAVALIAALLDETAVWEGFRRSFATERLAYEEYARTRAAGTWVIQPLADARAIRLVGDAVVHAEMARAGNAEDARAILLRAGQVPPPRGQSGSGGRSSPAAFPRYSRWFDESDFTAFRYAEQVYRIVGQRRATAVSLALRLYQADHAGRWPDQLADLVPAYLAAAPADPFYADRRPIGYLLQKGGLPGGGDRPLVYYDAGPADGVAIDPEPMFGWRTEIRPGVYVRDPFRQYLDVARWSVAVRRFDKLEAEERARAEADRLEQEEVARIAREEAGLPSTRPATGPAATEPTAEPGAATRPVDAATQPGSP
jgi:hypothetical protein